VVILPKNIINFYLEVCTDNNRKFGFLEFRVIFRFSDVCVFTTKPKTFISLFTKSVYPFSCSRRWLRQFFFLSTFIEYLLNLTYNNTFPAVATQKISKCLFKNHYHKKMLFRLMFSYELLSLLFCSRSIIYGTRNGIFVFDGSCYLWSSRFWGVRRPLDIGYQSMTCKQGGARMFMFSYFTKQKYFIIICTIFTLIAVN